MHPAEECRQAFADWVAKLDTWEWWVTLTFRDKEPGPDSIHWTKPGWSYAANAWGKFVKQIGAEQGWHDVRYVAGWELQRERGVPHIHAVVAGVDQVYRLGVKEWWYKRYGIARIMPFSKHQGCEYYMAKYMHKGGLVKLDILVDKERMVLDGDQGGYIGQVAGQG